MGRDLFIGGAWRNASGDGFQSLNPVTGEIIWSGNSAGADDVNQAVLAAKQALDSWANLSLDARLTVINDFSALAADRKEEIASLISKETGKALWDARTEAGAVAAKAAISLKAYHERTGSRETELGAANLRIAHRPFGVVAVLGPFNFPAHLPNGHIIPALIAGNTIVLKPSEQSPGVSAYILEIWEEAGLPPGVINLVQGAARPAQQLVDHPDVAGVLFTGGVKAGTAIHTAMAGQPHRMLALEMGGNNPLVVWDAGDLASAARIIVKSAYISAGQRCTCASRLIIPDGSQGDDILAALTTQMDQIAVSVPDADPQPFYASVISGRAASTVAEAQTKLKAQGGEILRSTEFIDNKPTLLRPALIDVTAVKEREDEEIFGPLLQVIRVRDFDAAIEEANDTRFGLAAGLVSDDADMFNMFANRVRAGIVNWNRQTTGASGAAPFGGPGMSGNLRPAGYYAADYCAWPMAGLVAAGPARDDEILPGMMP